MTRHLEPTNDAYAAVNIAGNLHFQAIRRQYCSPESQPCRPLLRAWRQLLEGGVTRAAR
jgi:hypothetical protein